ncbi:hypothetical protein CGCS363_v007756 [Colletotrichum siamense]|uniref:uncharacterized protein n=1 Tax=Colletotrichum siamense TaxID=690259 RepID=UPI0018730A81|nr:uncharacterized protein CGCS363_v007756 [Colletotrichum siamense]KAF5497715.1 hypothetical protein CGCS363_v007756 [Colletotrichum siamense]
MSRTPREPMRDHSMQSFEMRDTPTGYHSPLEQPHISRSDNLDSTYDSSSLSPQFKRKPVARLTSFASSEPGDYGLGGENRASTSKQSLLRKASAALPGSQYHWILEICAVILSILALAAIAILLPLYNNKPLSTWSFQYSFNTVVSILGATSRATLAFAVSACISQGKWNWFRRRDDTIMVFDRFEEASRGPWGGVRLLWWSRLRHWMALGALSTVVLVGFEPFLQAIITFEGKQVSVADPISKATIGKSSKLDIGSFSAITGAATGISTPDGTLMRLSMLSKYDFGALASIWSGFSTLGSVEAQTPSFSCSSGNCTWTPYASLAVCSACNDISQHIIKSTGKTNVSVGAEDDTLTMVNYVASFSPIAVPSINTTYTRYDIKELKMNISNIDSAGLAAIRGKDLGFTNTELTAKATSQPSETLSFQDFKTLIVSFAMIAANQEFRENGQHWEDSSVSAQECALYFCTNIYQSDIVQGDLRETILGTHTDRNLDSFLAKDPQYAASSKWYNANTSYTLYHGKTDMNRTDLQMFISKEHYHTSTGLDVGQDLKFNISQNAAESITGLFMNEFARRASPLATKQLVYPAVGTVGTTSQPHVIDSLGTSKNLTATFETVAASMSKYIRDLSLETEPNEGETQNWIVFIRVEWGFLSLPIAALLGGCLFCLLSIVETKRLGLPAWRGSSLAGLAHGLDKQSREQLREADGLSQMDEHAKLYKVRFVDSDLGPELKLSHAQAQ